LCHAHSAVLLACVFPGLLQKDFANLRRALCLLSSASGLKLEWFHSRIVECHFKACDSFVKRILDQENHSLHHTLSEAKSLQPGRCLCRIIPACHHPFSGLIPLRSEYSPQRAHSAVTITTYIPIYINTDSLCLFLLKML